MIARQITETGEQRGRELARDAALLRLSSICLSFLISSLLAFVRLFRISNDRAISLTQRNHADFGNEMLTQRAS